MLAWVERYRWLVIGLMAVPLLIGIGVLVDRQLQGPQPLEINLGETSSPSEIQVYVAGAVNRPGVYYLNDGDRWIDAVEAAGGPTADADLEAANLALPSTTRARCSCPAWASRQPSTPPRPRRTD